MWHPIPSLPGYEITRDGRVRNAESGYELTQRVSPSGYLFVQPSVGKKLVRRVHRLLAEVFIPNDDPTLWVLHNDGNSLNNSLQNLRWGTQSDNVRDSVLHGTHTCTARTHCPLGHPLTAPNLVPRMLEQRGVRNCLACARAHGLAASRRRRGQEPLPVQELADRKFTEIMETVA